LDRYSEVLSFGTAREDGSEAQPDVVFGDVQSLALREVNFTLKRNASSRDDAAGTVASSSHRVTISEPGATDKNPRVFQMHFSFQSPLIPTCIIFSHIST
jgi:hypothetical protein